MDVVKSNIKAEENNTTALGKIDARLGKWQKEQNTNPTLAKNPSNLHKLRIGEISDLPRSGVNQPVIEKRRKKKHEIVHEVESSDEESECVEGSEEESVESDTIVPPEDDPDYLTNLDVEGTQAEFARLGLSITSEVVAAFDKPLQPKLSQHATQSEEVAIPDAATIAGASQYSPSITKTPLTTIELSITSETRPD